MCFTADLQLKIIYYQLACELFVYQAIIPSIFVKVFDKKQQIRPATKNPFYCQLILTKNNIKISFYPLEPVNVWHILVERNDKG